MPTAGHLGRSPSIPSARGGGLLYAIADEGGGGCPRARYLPQMRTPQRKGKTMNKRSFLGGFGLGCATMCLAAATFISQDPPTTPQDPAETNEEMMRFQEGLDTYGAPNEEHKFLARRVGQWEAETEMWRVPGAPPETSAAEASFEMIMDGRYLLGFFEGEFNGKAFEGAGLSGYDRIKNKHFGMWIDSWSTMMMISEGDREGKTITYHGDMPDIITGQYHESKMVETLVDDDTFVQKMYLPGPDGKMFMHMRTTYKRVN